MTKAAIAVAITALFYIVPIALDAWNYHRRVVKLRKEKIL